VNLGAPEIILIIVAGLLLFGGYRKLPDASRSLGRSLRIFKGEMKGLKDDGGRTEEPAAAPAAALPVTGTAVPPAGADEDLLAQARAAEAHAAELRARALQARAEQLRAGEGQR
jgi:sec-independent protein translocase protein TatA